MSDTNNRMVLICGGVIVMVLIVCVIVSSKSKKHQSSVRQGWAPGPNFAGCHLGSNQIGCAAYPPSVDPMAYGVGTIRDYKAATPEDKQDTNAMVQKWFDFTRQVSPEISGAIYSLFPDLQTPESIANYGLTSGMVAVLKIISPKLKSPENVKTSDDVNRLFLNHALNVANIEMNEKPMSGLYSNAAEYEGIINVW